MEPSRLNVFQERIHQFQAEKQKLKRRSGYISAIRIAVFLITLVVLYLFFDSRQFGGVMAALFTGLLIFFVLVRIHNRVRGKLTIADRTMSINQREVAVQKHDLNKLNGGNSYQDALHPYSGDLDIFGSSSLFCLVNRSATSGGREQLASWLRTPLAFDKIKPQQEGVRELTEMIDWRQEFEAKGLDEEPEKATAELVEWLKSGLSDPQLGRIRILALFSSLSLLVLLALTALLGTSIYLPLIPLVVNLMILRSRFDTIKDIHTSTSRYIGHIDASARLLAMISETTYQSERLKALQKPLKEGAASRQIRQLHRMLDLLDSRLNLFYGIVDGILVIDIHILFAFQRWSRRNTPLIPEWFRCLYEMDAMTSLSGFSYAYPEFSYPVVKSAGEYSITARNIAHPLIAPDKRVGNDFKSMDRGALTLITGSNMSGKSTFQRTVGINMVLAYAGAPVCARQLEVGYFRIFTSMRIIDDLSSNMSSFYAELERIRQLLHLIEKDGPPVFYLLDEILLGTNSEDRHKGSVALIRQLLESEAMGIIATHDLKLGEMQQEESGITNLCFTSSIRNGQLIFDYKIRAGIGYNFNATELMKKMGLNV